MRSRSLWLVFCLAILPALVGCNQNSASGNSSNTPNTSTSCVKPSSNIKGQIVSISHTAVGNRQGGFLLDSSKEKNAAYNQAYIIVLNTTRVYSIQNGQCKAILFTALTRGQHIQIQPKGPIMQSYPLQIQAEEIVLLP
jgi:hypothetical protein